MATVNPPPEPCTTITWFNSGCDDGMGGNVHTMCESDVGGITTHAADATSTVGVPGPKLLPDKVMTSPPARLQLSKAETGTDEEPHPTRPVMLGNIYDTANGSAVVDN